MRTIIFVRKFIFLLTVLFVTIVSTQHVNAQISATAETTAKIVSGLQITKEAAQPKATFTITFPYSFSITNTDGSGSSMLVDGFTYNNITSPSTLDGNGNLTIKVGATLHVYNYQALGTYKNTTDLKITVAYN